MKLPVRILQLCTCLCMFVGFALEESSIDSTLRTVESLYAAGSYAQAELEGRRLLENDQLGDSVWISAEQWVAFSLVAQGKTALAKEHFLGILRRWPSHELDPILTSPKILAVFNDARATFLAQRTQETASSLIREASVPAGITFR